MRQIDSAPPNLSQSRGTWRGISSKGWAPRSTSGRVGVFIIGAIIVTCGLGMIAATFPLKGELQASIPSPLVGFLVSFSMVIVVLCVACWLLWYGSRLLMGSFRHPAIRKQ